MLDYNEKMFVTAVLLGLLKHVQGILCYDLRYMTFSNDNFYPLTSFREHQAVKLVSPTDMPF